MKSRIEMTPNISMDFHPMGSVDPARNTTFPEWYGVYR
jgi:hypothetical protein